MRDDSDIQAPAVKRMSGEEAWPMRDIHHPASTAEQPPRPPRRPVRRFGAWMSALTAVLVVGLLGVTFFSLARTRGINEPASATPGTLTPATPTQSAQTGCDATGIKGQLLSSTFLTDLAMTSRDEGWAVGGGGSDDNP